MARSGGNAWFDWGQVKTTWSPYEMMNHEIEMQ